MAENDSLPLEWDEVDLDADEEVTKEDQLASDDISEKRLIGKALCKITKVFPVEKNLKEYSCYAITLEHTIVDVIEAEMPVFDDKGKQLVRNGEPVFKVRVLTEEEKIRVNKKYVGKILGTDEIFMHHVSEKKNTQRRRLFVAKNSRIMAPDATQLKMGDWKFAEGKMVIVESERNRWKDKQSGEWRESGTKIKWDGYSLADMKQECSPESGLTSAEENTDEVDLSDI